MSVAELLAVDLGDLTDSDILDEVANPKPRSLSELGDTPPNMVACCACTVCSCTGSCAACGCGC
jgi:hypothetical protein